MIICCYAMYDDENLYNIERACFVSWHSCACKADNNGKLTVYLPTRPLNYNVKNSYLNFFVYFYVLFMFFFYSYVAGYFVLHIFNIHVRVWTMYDWKYNKNPHFSVGVGVFFFIFMWIMKKICVRRAKNKRENENFIHWSCDEFIKMIFVIYGIQLFLCFCRHGKL